MKTSLIQSNISNILLIIKKYKYIVCSGHINPDGDSLGSIFALKHFIKSNFPDKQVFMQGDTVPPYLTFLGQYDQVTCLDRKFLLIVCDTANKARIGWELWNYADFILTIDHHLDNELYADKSFLNAEYIANCEWLAHLLFASKLQINKECAKALYTGIITDSNRFLYPKTKPATLTIAGRLLEIFQDPLPIYDSLYIKTKKDLFIYQFLYRSVKFKDGIAYVIVKKEDLEYLEVSASKIKSYVNLFAFFDHIKIWTIIAYDQELNKYSVSLRSEKYDINQIAHKYDGGGHKLASGCKLNKQSEIKPFLKELRKIIQ